MSDELFSGSTGGDTPAGSILDQQLKGEVVKVLFANDDGQFVVLAIRDENDQEHTCVGPLGGIQEGQGLEVWGKWDTHKSFGRQFKVKRFQTIMPSTADGIKRYLSSGIIPGIGEKLAERIVDHFGGDTLNILDHYSSRLSEVEGLGKQKIAKIKQAWTEQTEQRENLIFLQGLSISTAYCGRIIKRYGDETISAVSENPYRLASDIRGIGFKMADDIAMHLNIAKDNLYRLGSGIVYVLTQQADQQGHVCLPEDILLAAASDILDVEAEKCHDGLERAIEDGAVIRGQLKSDDGFPYVYKRSLYIAETDLTDIVSTRLKYGQLPGTRFNEGLVSDQWAMLNGEQRQAVASAFENPVSIITGGPGVGKTTVTKEIVHVAKTLNMRVSLTAPTGRAAKRLNESSGHHAMTIHRLLKWEPEKNDFYFNRETPIASDLVIVDEISMLDINLAVSLFSAIGPKTRIVMVGDRDQLPSVGPGSVLRDFISSGLIAVTHLREIYRQSADSQIIQNAHRVNSGNIPHLAAPQSDQLQDFYWIEQDDPEQALATIGKMITERIPDRFKLDPLRDIQVLCPMNRGICGTANLNTVLQTRLNPQKNQLQFSFGDTLYRAGDRVMQIVNNYDSLAFNGDLGTIEFIDYASKTFRVKFENNLATYGFDEAGQIRHSYAITIHKSQGSEFPCVIVPVLTQHYVMLQRNLIYTAMTRAKQLLIMVGASKALTLAVKNYRLQPRYSNLERRLVQGLQSG